MGLEIRVTKQNLRTDAAETVLVWHKEYLLGEWLIRQSKLEDFDRKTHFLSFETLLSLRNLCRKTLAATDWKAELQNLFPVPPDWQWTEIRENAYRTLLRRLASDAEMLMAIPLHDGEALFYQVSY